MKVIGGVYVEERYNRGVTVGQYSREKSLSVLSLSDFTVKTAESKLKVRKSRVEGEPNTFNITLLVPKSVTTAFTTSLEITN